MPMQDFLGCCMVLMWRWHVCICFIKKERGFATLVLLLILSKLIWENTVGSLGTAELIGSPVLVEAHLLG